MNGAIETTRRGYRYSGYRTGQRVESKTNAKGEEVPTPHGTSNGYVNFRCRCDECRAAWRDYCNGRKK